MKRNTLRTLTTLRLLVSLFAGALALGPAPARAGMTISTDDRDDRDEQEEREEREREKEEQKSIGEALDHAARRAQAFRDMYADEFGNVDKEAKLRAAHLNQMEEQTGRRGALTGALAINGSTWTNLGPTNFAGRVSSIAVDPTNGNVIYRGTAGGGVWKSTDGGATWKALTDGLGDLSIGAVALAPSNPQIVYVGTGEGAFGTGGIDGIGFLKSTDGGATWILPSSVVATKFFDLSVHPTNPNEIVAGTDAGVLKSTNGGSTWVNTYPTYVAPALARMPGTPATILASSWAWNDGTNRGFIQRSTDGGSTWAGVAEPGRFGFSLDTGRISLSFSPASSSVVYAMAASAAGDSKGCSGSSVDQSGIYRSTDAGRTWALRSNPVTGTCGVGDGLESILGGQGWYANTIRADAANASIVYAGGLDMWKSTDGGATFAKRSQWYGSQTSAQFVHADIHAMAFAGATLLIGNDGGIYKTTDGAATFTNLNTGVVTRQYYALALSAGNRNLIIGGAQDNGTNVRTTTGTVYSEVIGGDGFGVAAHPTNTSILYGTVYSTRIFRTTDGGATWPEIGPQYGQAERAPFITPLTMDPTNPSILYTGTNYLWKTTNGGTSWFKPNATDLGDGFSNLRYVTKIAVARSNASYILTATGSGQVRKSTNGGTTFSAPLAGLPVKYVTHVEFDPTNVNVFYVTYAGGSVGGRIYKTVNGGTSFTQIDSGLPNFPVHVIKVDPTDSSALYAGSDLGLFRSTDGGTSWARFGTGLPAVSVWDIGILPDGSLMRVATHGRGFWELSIGGTQTGDTARPTTSITAPASGATVSGTATVSATASDNVAVTKLEVYVDGVLKSSNTNATSLSYWWDTRTASNGSHTVSSKAYDAAGNVGTSANVTVTVSNAASQQLLGNRGFENGTANITPWASTYGVIDGSTGRPARSGYYKAWLNGYGQYSSDALAQTVTIPANVTSATLSFYLRIDTDELTTAYAYDTLTVQVRNASTGALLATLASYSNLNATNSYVLKSFNLSAYKGQTVQIYFSGQEDVDTQTSFVIDDTSLSVQ